MELKKLKPRALWIVIPERPHFRLPPISSHFSARGRMGIRSRYVDTCNQGVGNPMNLVQSPSAASTKPASGAKPAFFVPAPVSSVEQQVETPTNGLLLQDTSSNNATPLSSSASNTLQSPRTPSMTLQRYASMDNICNRGTSNNDYFSAHSRRTASWSGNLNDSFSPPNTVEIIPLGEVLGMHPSPVMNDDSSLVRSSTNGGKYSKDLHEVYL